MELSRKLALWFHLIAIKSSRMKDDAHLSEQGGRYQSCILKLDFEDNEDIV